MLSTLTRLGLKLRRSTTNIHTVNQDYGMVPNVDPSISVEFKYVLWITNCKSCAFEVIKGVIHFRQQFFKQKPRSRKEIKY